MIHDVSATWGVERVLTDWDTEEKDKQKGMPNVVYGFLSTDLSDMGTIPSSNYTDIPASDVFLTRTRGSFVFQWRTVFCKRATQVDVCRSA